MKPHLLFANAGIEFALMQVTKVAAYKFQFKVYRSYMACNLQVGEINFNWNVFSLYKALKDDVTYANFMEYLMITQEPWQYGANNVYFWLEVQKCKVRVFNHNFYRECAKHWLAC